MSKGHLSFIKKLDELKQASAEDTDAVAYMLVNIESRLVELENLVNTLVKQEVL
jgi:hypothetical protein